MNNVENFTNQSANNINQGQTHLKHSDNDGNCTQRCWQTWNQTNTVQTNNRLSTSWSVPGDT